MQYISALVCSLVQTCMFAWHTHTAVSLCHCFEAGLCCWCCIHTLTNTNTHVMLLLLHVLPRNQYNRSDASHQILDGGFAVSSTRDLWSHWNYSSWREPAYTNAVEWSDGGSNQWVDRMQRRERPFLLHDEDGAPTHLYTAVCPPGDTTNSECYTIVNPLKPKTKVHTLTSTIIKKQ